MQIRDMIQYLDGILEPLKYRDYAPNGLQVEGRSEVRRVVTGVTACRALINAARERGADCLLVHHGWFWKGEEMRIIGVRHRRIRSLIDAGLNLVAYHLPLDDNEILGNNVLLGKALGVEIDARFGEEGFARTGLLPQEMRVEALAENLAVLFNRKPLCVGKTEGTVRRIGWCTGAAQDMIEDAVAAGCDCYISGEISERTFHLAHELGIAYLACGHHATERFGIRALGEKLAADTGLDVEFIDIKNPV